MTYAIQLRLRYRPVSGGLRDRLEDELATCWPTNMWQAFSGWGAFRYFKEVLADYPREPERWPEFKDARLRQRVLDWFASQGIEPLASLGRRLAGHAQSFNRGGDVFLAEVRGNYMGRTCPWRDCGPGFRQSCDVLHADSGPIFTMI